jgi:spermidine synthase
MKLRIAALVIGLAAFVSLSYEILWYRALAFVSGDPASTFGLLLAYYLAGLAGGSLMVGKMCRQAPAAPEAAPWLRVAAFIGIANLVGYSVGPLLGWFARTGVWVAALPLVALSASGLGAILPLMTHYAVPPDERAGARLSYLYAANILGSASGSLLTGYILLDVLTLRQVALLLALFGLGLALVVVLHARHDPRSGRTTLLLLAAAVLVVLGNNTAFGALYEKLLYKDTYQPGMHFTRVVENRVGVIAVTPQSEVFGGGVYDGMILTDPVADRNGILRCYAVAGMHPGPKRILVIGMATGAWAQVLAHTPGLEHLTVVEINPGYLELIRDYPVVASLLRNPIVDIVIDDGRRWLRRNPDARFDLIVANTTFNWRSHSTNLLSVEYLQLIRRHLSPGGIYYFNTTDSPDAAKTAFTIFTHGLRFRNFVAVSDSPFRLDRERWASAMQQWRIDGHPVLDPSRDAARERLASLGSEASWQNGPELEDRETVLARVEDARVITDDNMVTEWLQVFPPLWLP